MSELMQRPSKRPQSWLDDIQVDYSATYVILATLAINVLSLALPIASLQVYDRIIAKNGISTLNILALGIVVALALESILQLARSYVSGWIGAVIEHRIYSKAVHHILQSREAGKSKQTMGAQLQKLSAVGQMREFYSGQALAAMIDLPFVMVFLGLIAYLTKALVLVPLGILAFFALRAWMGGRYTELALRKRDMADDARYDFLIETLSGIHTTKSLGLEQTFIRKYESLQQKSSLANFHLTRLSAEALNDGQIYGQIMLACIVTFGAPMVVAGQFTMGSLIACILLAGRILQPIQKSLNLWLRFQDFKGAHEKLDDFFSTRIDPVTIAKTVPESGGKLELREVSYSNPDHPNHDLHLINWSLQRGDCVAIAGDQDEAKTQILRLITAEERPQNGEILLDGIAVQSYPNEKLIEHVAYLPMQGAIFQGSIYDNLSHFGRISLERVEEIAALMGIDMEIAKLPDGMNTMLEDIVADPVPPGLKQRIAIARSLAYKPRLILFDNADRGLDKEGYNNLYRLLGRLKNKATMVIVSDDHNIRSLADREWILANGMLRLNDKVAPRQKSNMKIMELVS